MAKKIRWSPKAASNFEEICNYIAKDSEVYATLFANKINDENIREKIYENYRIVYRTKGEFIEIVAISHGSKPLENIL